MYLNMYINLYFQNNGKITYYSKSKHLKIIQEI